MYLRSVSQGMVGQPGRRVVGHRVTLRRTTCGVRAGAPGAPVIGTIEVGGLISSELDLSGSFWNWFENVDLGFLGFVIIAMFIATWVIAFLVWRLGRIEERWSTHLQDSTSGGTTPAS